MAKKCKVEVELVVKDEKKARAVAIETVRSLKLYGPKGVETYVDGKTVIVPLEEWLGDIRDALMELVQSNPLFEKAGVEVESVTGAEPEEVAARLGSRGGKARAKNLSKKRLSEIGKAAAAKRWAKNGEKATIH